MSLKFSLNIFLTKIRTMYSFRIQGSVYDQMISCKSLKGVLKILRENQFYVNIFENVKVNDESLSLLSVEKLLDYKFLDVLENILSYDKLLNGFLKDYILAYIDSKFILSCFERILKLKCGKDFFFNSMHRDSVCKNLKLKGLIQAKSVEGFFDFLNKAGYKELFKNLDLKNNDFFIQSFVQKKLYEDLYEKLISGISRIKNKKVKKELLSVYFCYLELNDFVYRLRSKKVGNEDKNIELLPSFRSFEQRFLRKLENLNLESEYYSFLNSSFLSSQIKNINYSYLEQLPEKFLFLKSKKNIRFSLNPTVVVVSFINLLKIELQNIKRILEGIRYNLPSNKIKEFLVV